jgi:hypothetical protein
MFFSFLSILKGCYGNPIIGEMNMLEKLLEIYASVNHYYYDYDPSIQFSSLIQTLVSFWKKKYMVCR